MTQDFNAFLKQHKTIGSEKADGYSQDAFIGLTSQEKDKVFKLLTTELPWSVEWLFFLDAKNATTIVAELEENWRYDLDRDAYKLQQTLVKYTGDLIYQTHIIEDYCRYDGDRRSLVVDAIRHTPTNTETINFFKHVILTEVNRDALAGASIYFLDSMNVPNKTDEDRRRYDRLLDDLRNNNTATKLRAILQVQHLALNSAPRSSN